MKQELIDLALECKIILDEDDTTLGLHKVARLLEAYEEKWLNVGIDLMGHYNNGTLIPVGLSASQAVDNLRKMYA